MQKEAFLKIKLTKCQFIVFSSCMQSQRITKTEGAFIILHNDCCSLPPRSDCYYQNGKTTMVAQTLKSKFEFPILNLLISHQYLCLINVSLQYSVLPLSAAFGVSSWCLVPQIQRIMARSLRRVRCRSVVCSPHVSQTIVEQTQAMCTLPCT